MIGSLQFSQLKKQTPDQMKNFFSIKVWLGELVGCVNKIREHELLINRSKLIIQSRNETFPSGENIFFHISTERGFAVFIKCAAR